MTRRENDVWKDVLTALVSSELTLHHVACEMYLGMMHVLNVLVKGKSSPLPHMV